MEQPSASSFVVDGFEFGPMLSMFLTTHYKAADDLSSGWRDAGYDTFAPLSSASPNSVCVVPLKNEGCIALAESYLSTGRPEDFQGDGLQPYNEETIVALGEQSSYHPRHLIHNLHLIVEAGMKDPNILRLDKESAMSLLEGQESIVETDVSPTEDFGFDE